MKGDKVAPWWAIGSRSFAGIVIQWWYQQHALSPNIKHLTLKLTIRKLTLTFGFDIH